MAVAGDSMSIGYLAPDPSGKFADQPTHREESGPYAALLQKSEEAIELAPDLDRMRGLIHVPMIAQLLTAIIFEVDRE
jgi:hypothetical protein